MNATDGGKIRLPTRTHSDNKQTATTDIDSSNRRNHPQSSSEKRAADEENVDPSPMHIYKKTLLTASVATQNAFVKEVQEKIREIAPPEFQTMDDIVQVLFTNKNFGGIAGCSLDQLKASIIQSFGKTKFNALFIQLSSIDGCEW